MCWSSAAAGPSRAPERDPEGRGLTWPNAARLACCYAHAGRGTAERSPLALLVGALLALGLVRAAARLSGLLALLGVVIGCVAALTVGILILRLALLH